MQAYVKKMVEGQCIPGIINNMHYHLTQFGVYEDASVAAWGRHDLKAFAEEVEREKIVTEIPVGKALTVFHVGAFVIEEARWLFTKEEYIEHIRQLICSMNPEFKNVYEETPRIRGKWDKTRVRFMDDPVSCKITNPGYSVTDGKSGFLFYRSEGKCSLTLVACFSDGTFTIDALPGKNLSLNDIFDMFDRHILDTKPEPGEWIDIDHIGSVRLSCLGGCVPIPEKKAELEDNIRKLCGEATSLEKCRDRYYSYLENPSSFNRDLLRKAYEAVPEHERCYLGDMDTTDSDYVRILYHPEEKREV